MELDLGNDKTHLITGFSYFTLDKSIVLHTHHEQTTLKTYPCAQGHHKTYRVRKQS